MEKLKLNQNEVNKMKYNKIKKYLSLLLSMSLIFSVVLEKPIYSQNEITKYETVYTNLRSDGQEKETIVSNWLKDSRFYSEVIDKSNISDINNISNDNMPVFKNNDIMWNTDSKDIYYQGETTKTLPISTKITYYLDGKEISANDIAGKSGKVKINIKFINNTIKSVNVNGVQKAVSTPFTVATVIGFDNEKFSDIQAENSKIFSDGNNQMVMFIGFPGLNNSLNLKSTSIEQLEDIDIPSEFTIKADVKEFELNSIAIVASPQIPEMLKDIKGIDDLDTAKKDIDTVINTKDTINKIDEKDTIKELIKNPKKTENAKLLIDDLFEYYDLDKELFDILPKYITDENIKLYDDAKKDLKDADINYVLDNQVLRYIPDRLNDKQIDKTRLLISDYDEIKTFDMDRFDKVLEIINNYDNMQLMIESSSNLYDKIKKHDKELDTLEKMTKYSDRIFDLMDRVENEGFGGSLTQSDIDYMLKALAEKKTKEMSHMFTSLLPENETDPLSNEQKAKLTILIDQGMKKGQIGVTTGAQLNTLINTGYIPEPYRTQILQMFTQGAQREIMNQISSATSQAESLLYDLRTIQIDVQNDIGYNYRSDLRTALEFTNEIMPEIRTIREQEKKNEETVRKAIDLAKNKDDMKYFQYWANRIKEMKKDMDYNDENINIMKDLLNEYNDPKIKHFYEKIPTLRKHIDKIRPILNSLSDELDIKKYNDSLHKSPKTLQTLLKMKEDLDNNKDIADTLKLSLDDEVVKVAREMIEVIERRDEKGDLEKSKNKLDDLQDIIDRKDAIITLSDNYTTFTGKQNDMNSSVTFVMKTDEIKIPKKKETFVPKQEEKQGFLDWIKGIFIK